MDPEDLIADVAAQYDNAERELTAGALRRLAWRKARSGATCSVCESWLPVSAFGPDGRKPNGLKHTCRACLAAKAKEARQASGVVPTRPPTLLRKENSHTRQTASRPTQRASTG